MLLKTILCQKSDSKDKIFIYAMFPLAIGQGTTVG